MISKRMDRWMYIACMCTAVIVAGCKKNKNDDPVKLTGDWVQRSTFEGVVRSNAAGFDINGKGYVGTGFDGINRLKDFWEYDPELNFWQQKADFPGAARNEAVGFGANGKGYIGTGYDGTTIYKDFYEYDPDSNQWTQKADFTGSARYGAVAFSLYNKGYVGTGFDGNNRKDFYKYDPDNNSWTQIVSPAGDKRIDAAAFVVGEKAYLCTGVNNGNYLNDLWEYDPTTGLWNQKAALSADDNSDGKLDRDVRRYGAVGFAAKGNGYISCGYYNGLTNSTWQYSPSANTWTQRVNFEASGRMDAVGLTLGNRGFVLAGKNGNSRYDDFWEFQP